MRGQVEYFGEFFYLFTFGFVDTLLLDSFCVATLNRSTGVGIDFWVLGEAARLGFTFSSQCH